MSNDLSSVLLLFSWGANGWGDELLLGAWLTLQLALVSLVCGLLLGLVLTLAKLSRVTLLRWLVSLYVLIIRGVPEFLILLLVFFGLEALVNQMLALMGLSLNISIPKFTAAVIGLALIFSAYAVEVFRGAYLAVPQGQIEAAWANGMSSSQIFWRIRLPQLWRFALPGLGNLWMVMLKDTSLAAVIALDELLRVAKIASEASQSPLAFFVIAALLYLVMAVVSDRVRYRIEKRARRGFSTA